VNTADIFHHLKYANLAQLFYNAVIEAEPNNATAHCKLATHLFKYKDYEEAEKHYATARALDPSITNLIQYARFKADTGQVESGKLIFEEALQLYPTNPTLHHAYANFLVTARNSLPATCNYVEEANNHYATAIRYHPDSLDLLLDYGNFLKDIIGDAKKGKNIPLVLPKVEQNVFFCLKGFHTTGLVIMGEN